MATGFFWKTNTEYHVVIIDDSRMVRQGRRKVKFCKEYSGLTPEELISACLDEKEETGYDIGSPEAVAALCESAPRSPKKNIRLKRAAQFR